MNYAHVHLILNHIPVFGALFGLVLLAYGVATKSRDVKIAAFAVFAVTALIAIPTFLTGEPAEGVIEHMQGFSEGLVDQHQESAELSLIALLAAGILSTAGLILSRGTKAMPRWMVPAVLALGVVTVGLMVRTANLGGQIRHTEIRGDVVNLGPGGEVPAEQPAKTESD